MAWVKVVDRELRFGPLTVCKGHPDTTVQPTEDCVKKKVYSMTRRSKRQRAVGGRQATFISLLPNDQVLYTVLFTVSQAEYLSRSSEQSSNAGVRRCLLLHAVDPVCPLMPSQIYLRIQCFNDGKQRWHEV